MKIDRNKEYWWARLHARDVSHSFQGMRQLIIQVPTVTEECRTAIKGLYLYFNLCLSVMLASLSCSYTYPYPFLLKKVCTPPFSFLKKKASLITITRFYVLSLFVFCKLNSSVLTFLLYLKIQINSRYNERKIIMKMTKNYISPTNEQEIKLQYQKEI